jgi:hypothetical protein
MRINRLLREFTGRQRQVTALEPYRYSQRVFFAMRASGFAAAQEFLHGTYSLT